MRIEFASVTVSFFIHATEDSERLLSIVSEDLGVAREELQTENIVGHYGNAIVSVKAHIIGRGAQGVATLILRSLSEGAKKQVLLELEKSMDEHDALYLRIDRQSIDRELVISDEEPIRVKLKPKFRAGGRASMREGYEEMIR